MYAAGIWYLTHNVHLIVAKKVTLRDVYNLVAEFKKEKTGGNSDDVTLAKHILQYLVNDEKASVSLYENSRNMTGSVFAFTYRCLRILMYDVPGIYPM